MEYRVHLPGKSAPNSPGDSPTFPPSCDGIQPDQGGSPCTANGNAGPSAPDPVDLTNGQESYEPDPDITVYNPNGPSVFWRRTFRTNHSLSGYASDGLGSGWAHNYDIAAETDPDTPEEFIPLLQLRYPGGAKETLVPVTNAEGEFLGSFDSNRGKYRATGIYNATLRQYTYLTVTWKDGTRWTLSYSASFPGALILRGIRNRAGRSITFHYTSGDTLSTIKDETSGVVLLSLVHQNGYLQKVVDAYGRAVFYDIQDDDLIEVSQISTASGPTPPLRWQYAYSHTGGGNGGASLLTQVTVPSPTGTGTATSTIEYESGVFVPRVTALVDAYGNRTEFEYHSLTYYNGYPNGGHTRVYRKDSYANLLSRTVFHYDNDKRDIGSDVEDFNGNVIRTTQTEYDNGGLPFLPTKVTSDGRITQYTYDYYGNVLTSESSGRTTSFGYKQTAFPHNRLETITEHSVSGDTRVLATFGYTPEGYLASVETPSPAGGTATTTFTYDSLGNIAQVSAPGVTAAQPLVTTYNYESDGGVSVQPTRLGQPVAIINPLGQVTHIRYDAQGRPVSVTDNAGLTTNYTYNVAGQIESVLLPPTGKTGAGRGGVENLYLYTGGPQTTTRVYDESGQITHQTQTEYGQEGEVTAVFGDTAEPVRYYYDGLRRLVALENAAQNALSYYYYNEVGDRYAELLVNTNDPTDLRQRNFDYDIHGNLLKQTDFYWEDYFGTLKTLRYEYDPLDFALTGVFPNDDLTDPIATYTYDDWRRVHTRTDRTGTQTYNIGDNANELLSVVTQYTNLPPLSVGYTYKHNGARATMTTPAGTFAYGYDVAGRPTTLTNPANETTAWAYEPVRGLLQSQTSANGIVAQYVHDALGRVTGLTNRDGSNNILSEYTTPATGGFDSVGNRLEVNANIPAAPSLSGITQWAYNSQSRLTGEQSARSGGWNNTHAYDAAGNLTTLRGQSRTYDKQNQLTGGQGLGAFAYDSRGNPTVYNGVNLTWDEQDNATAFGTLLTAGYTADGLRAWKEDAQNSRTYFLYDGVTPILELYADGSAKASNTWGANGLVSRREYTNGGASQASVFYGFDERGNTSERTDSAGQVLTRTVTDAYGNTTATDATGTALPNLPDSYSGYGAQFGYYADSETGLYLCTFRYYDPQNARWINKDPIGYDGGINTCVHVIGNVKLESVPFSLVNDISPVDDV